MLFRLCIESRLDFLFVKNSFTFAFLPVTVSMTSCSSDSDIILKEDFSDIVFILLKLFSQIFNCSDNQKESSSKRKKEDNIHIFSEISLSIIFKTGLSSSDSAILEMSMPT
jgi:hypothetical protein